MVVTFIKRVAMGALAASFSLVSTASPIFMRAVSAASEVDVTGNTVNVPLGENGSEGWWFNRDASTSSPFEFRNGNASIGSGSLYVPPVGANPSDKFIGELFVFDQMGDVETFSYDFKMTPSAVVNPHKQFYLNVYANYSSSGATKFYDCRYNVVPTTGSTSDFITVTFDVDGTYPVTTRGSSPVQPCPGTPSDMGDDAYIRVFALNLGDTTTVDTGLGGYFDKVVYDANGDVTTYDFERQPNTGEITSPLAGSTVNGSVDLTATYQDNDPDVDGVQWAVREGTCAAGTGTVAGNVDGFSNVATWDGASFSYLLDTTSLNDGLHCFVFNPSDDAGENNVRLTREFTIDNTAPAVPTDLHRIAADDSERLECGDVTARQILYPTWEANTESDFAYYEYSSFNNGAPGIVEQNLGTSNQFVHSWTPPADGTFGFQVRAVDVNGNESEWSDICEITYDSVDPVVELTDPEAGDVLRGTEDLAGTVKDDNNDRHRFILRDLNNNSIAWNSGNMFDEAPVVDADASVDTTTLPDGDYRVVLIGIDKAGNSGRDRARVEIDNVPDRILDCFWGAWADYGFRNQGQCVKTAVQSNEAPSFTDGLKKHKKAASFSWFRR